MEDLSDPNRGDIRQFLVYQKRGGNIEKVGKKIRKKSGLTEGAVLRKGKTEFT